MLIIDNELLAAQLKAKQFNKSGSAAMLTDAGTIGFGHRTKSRAYGLPSRNTGAEQNFTSQDVPRGRERGLPLRAEDIIKSSMTRKGNAKSSRGAVLAL